MDLYIPLIYHTTYKLASCSALPELFRAHSTTYSIHDMLTAIHCSAPAAPVMSAAVIEHYHRRGEHDLNYWWHHTIGFLITLPLYRLRLFGGNVQKAVFFVHVTANIHKKAIILYMSKYLPL